MAALAQAGGVTLTQTIAVTGLGAALSAELGRWRKPLAVRDPAKVLLDLAVTLALGGDCLADLAILRSEPALYGPVASDPTVSRLIDALAADAPAALAAIDRARAGARAQAWTLAGHDAPDHDASAKNPLIVDLDATLITSHSDKEKAARTWKKGFGFHPLCAFVDHGVQGTCEPLAVLLRAGNAGSNTAADHISVCRQAFAQLPGHKPACGPTAGPGGGYWSAPTAPGRPTRSLSTSTDNGCPTRSGSPWPPTPLTCSNASRGQVIDQPSPDRGLIGAQHRCGPRRWLPPRRDCVGERGTHRSSMDPVPLRERPRQLLITGITSDTFELLHSRSHSHPCTPHRPPWPTDTKARGPVGRGWGHFKPARHPQVGPLQTGTLSVPGTRTRAGSPMPPSAH